MFELHVLPLGERGGGSERFVVYRPVARLAFVGNRAMADLAVAASRGQNGSRHPDAHAFLEDIGFLEPDPAKPAQPAEEFRPSSAVLLMTNECQLRCTYCYAAAGEGTGEILDPDLGRAVIDYVCGVAVEDGRPDFEVALHGGGEPTRAWSSLRACVEHARAKPLPARVALTSNAVWSRRQLDWIVENVDGLTVSVDGGPETQDAQRPFASGRGSSGIVFRNLAELDRLGFPYAIRATVTAPWDRLPHDVRLLCETTECQLIRVEPAFNTVRGGRPEPRAEDCRAFGRAFRDAFAVARDAGRHLVYSGAQVGSVTGTFCSAPYDALIVGTRGELVTCYEVTSPTHPLAGISTIGRVVNGAVMIDEVARRRLRRLLEERRRACEGCWCYFTCAGDCYARAFEPTDGGHLAYGPRCALNRDTTRSVLLALIASGAGVWRGGEGGR